MSVFIDHMIFMQACDQTVGKMNPAQYEMYLALIKEETQELNDAFTAGDRVEQLDALIDIMVVTIGALHSMGVDAEGAWREVLRSNLGKIDASTGKVLKREDGKVLKPEGWEPPQLKSFLRRP
jgi:predicted HAD superfamily Cof-like phosphohydrolase